VGRPDGAGITAPTVLEVTNRDAVARTVTLGFVRDGDEGETTVHPGADHPVFTLEPGASRRVRVTLRVEGLPQGPAALGGWLLLQLDGGAVQRVPVAVAAGGSGPTPTLVRTPELSRSVLAVEGTAADRRTVTLSARLGAVEARGDGSIVLTPVRRLRVDLYRGRTALGSVHAARDLLPGRYGWSLTPRRPDGGPLAPGRYRLVLRADGDAGATSTASVTFRVR
jgi:hypothetical protein